MENEEIITLTKCDNTIVADEIVSKLASNGITASLHDELNDPAYGAYGPNPGIEVRVLKKDYEQSQHILNEIISSRSEQLPWCPSCGSNKIKALRNKEGKRSTLAILLGIVLIILGCAGLILPNFVEALATIRLYGFSSLRLYYLVAFCWYCPNKTASTTNAPNVARCLRNNNRKTKEVFVLAWRNGRPI